MKQGNTVRVLFISHPGCAETQIADTNISSKFLLAIFKPSSTQSMLRYTMNKRIWQVVVQFIYFLMVSFPSKLTLSFVLKFSDDDIAH
jgi:hypothetical protein